MIIVLETLSVLNANVYIKTKILHNDYKIRKKSSADFMIKLFLENFYHIILYYSTCILNVAVMAKHIAQSLK